MCLTFQASNANIGENVRESVRGVEMGGALCSDLQEDGHTESHKTVADEVVLGKRPKITKRCFRVCNDRSPKRCVS